MRKKHFEGLRPGIAALLSVTMLMSPLTVGAATTSDNKDETPLSVTSTESTESTEPKSTEATEPSTETPIVPLTNYQDAREKLGFTATVDTTVERGAIKLAWKAPDDKTKGYKIFMRDKANENWVEQAKVTDTSYTDNTFSGDYDTADILQVYLVESYDNADCTGNATGLYIGVATPYLNKIETGDSKDQALFSFSTFIPNEAITYNLFASAASGSYTEASKDEVSSLGLVLNDITTESGKTLKCAVAAYDVATPGFEIGKTYYGQVSVTYTIEGRTFTSGTSNEASFTVSEVQPVSEETVYTYELVGLTYNASNSAENIARLNTYLKFDGTLQPKDYTHPGITLPGAEGGYVIFLIPNGFSSGITSFDLSYSASEDGSNPTKFDSISKSDTKRAFQLSTSIMEGFETWAVFTNKLPFDGNSYYFTVSPVGGSTLKTSPAFSIAMPDWVQDVTVTANNAKKLTILWRHDDCVKSYEIYRSVSDVSAYDDNSKFDISNYKKIGKVNAKKNIVKQEGIKYHKFIEKKCPSADKYYYYMIKPIFAVSAFNNTSDPFNLNSEPVEGKGDVTKSKVKSLTASCKSLTQIALTWKGLKNVSTYQIYRNGEWLDEKTVEKKNQKQQQTYVDKTVKPGKGYVYSIRPGDKEGDEGKSTKSNKVDCVPKAVTNLKASYRTAGQGATLSWSGDQSDSDAATSKGYTYAYEVKTDSTSWQRVNENKWDDTSALNNGATRAYAVRVTIYKDGSAVCSSPDVTVKYVASGKLTVYIENGVDVVTKWPAKYTMKVGGKAIFKAYSDSKAALSVVCTSGAGAVTLGQSALNDKAGKSGLLITFGGVAVGTQTFELRTSDGAVRRFEMTVTQ